MEFSFSDLLEVIGTLVEEVVNRVPVVCEDVCNGSVGEVTLKGGKGGNERFRRGSIRMGLFIPSEEDLDGRWGVFWFLGWGDGIWSSMGCRTSVRSVWIAS